MPHVCTVYTKPTTGKCCLCRKNDMIFTLLYDKIFFLNDGLCEMYVLLAVSSLKIFSLRIFTRAFLTSCFQCGFYSRFQPFSPSLALKVNALASKIRPWPWPRGFRPWPWPRGSRPWPWPRGSRPWPWP